MSNIIDNVKVGNHIKKLLKKNQMTQTKLAEILSISKSAVSQNLSGRSTFDIENLIKIAKLFDMSVEALISGETENKHAISNYEVIVERGLDAIKSESVDDLRIAEPDFYGKVLVDYIIDKEKRDMLLYLHNHNASFTHDYFRRAKEIYLRVMLTLLEHNVKDIVKYFIAYKRINKSLEFEDDKKAYLIWKLLDKPDNQDVVKQIINTDINHKKKFFNVFEYNQSLDLIKKDELLLFISKYKLKNVLSSYLNTIHKEDDFALVFDTFIEHQFIEGINEYVKYYDHHQLSSYKKVSIGVQRCVLKLIEEKHFDLVVEFIKNRLYTNLTEILRLSIEHHQDHLSSHIIANHKDDIVFKRIGEYCIDYKNTDLMKKIYNYLTNEDLDYLLSYTKPNDIESMVFLVEHGAKMKSKYYNLDTYDKFNKLIEYFMDKEA